MIRMPQPGSTSYQMGAHGHCVLDDFLKTIKTRIVDHRSSIDYRDEAFRRCGQYRTNTQFADALGHLSYEFVVERGVNNEALNADTILTHRLAGNSRSGVSFLVERIHSESHNAPRIQTLDHFLMFVRGNMIAGSFPPSSRVTGVRCFVAATATFRPMVYYEGHLTQINFSDARIAPPNRRT
jgi:hypothetical protein